MQLISYRNHDLRGMIPCTTAHGLNFTFAVGEFIQILKSNSENHFLVVRGINDNDRDEIEFFDSYHETFISEIPEQIVHVKLVFQCYVNGALIKRNRIYQRFMQLLT